MSYPRHYPVACPDGLSADSGSPVPMAAPVTVPADLFQPVGTILATEIQQSQACPMSLFGMCTVMQMPGHNGMGGTADTFSLGQPLWAPFLPKMGFQHMPSQCGETTAMQLQLKKETRFMKLEIQSGSSWIL
ncbi:unnamed protein product [Anisakis simplex]|uniref:POU-specific domain-containing protein n=1 Tax=Anisakis simplex TaxID=6269 RepID=A0A0M3K3K3_ANISI|nr:unnamed protein product [Anisakis simplex]